MSCHTGEHLFHWQGSTHANRGQRLRRLPRRARPERRRYWPSRPSPAFATSATGAAAQFLRQSRHPVQGDTAAMSHVGLLSCTDCHQPHGGPGPALLARNTINESCYDCHAEKRGPPVGTRPRAGGLQQLPHAARLELREPAGRPAAIPVPTVPHWRISTSAASIAEPAFRPTRRPADARQAVA